MNRHGRVRPAYFSHREAGKGVGNKHDQAIVTVLLSVGVSQSRSLLDLEGWMPYIFPKRLPSLDLLDQCIIIASLEHAPQILIRSDKGMVISDVMSSYIPGTFRRLGTKSVS